MRRVSPTVFASDPERLSALERYDILDTAPEPGFDDIVAVACAVCECRTALVSFVGHDRQWFKARVGFDLCETGLDRSVCVHAITVPAGELLVIGDLADDPRSAANPLVTGEPRIRFYAGAPLRTAAGHVLGSLCVLDVRPRPEGLTPIQETTLRALAGQVVSLLELRRAVQERDAALERRQQDNDRRETLVATQAAISASSGDLDTILDHLVAGAMKAVPAAQGGVIELLDGDTLVYRAAQGTLARHQGFRIGLEGSLSGLALTGGQAIRVADAPLDTRADKKAVAHLGMRAALFVPMRPAGRPIGVLMLQSAVPGAFGARDLETAQLFAATVPLALAEVGQAAARRLVRDSERRHRAIFESAIDYAIVVLDLDGIITNWNEGARRILGWTAEETLGQPAALFFTPEDRAVDIPGDEMRAALKTGRGLDERWHLRKDGSRFWANGEMMTLRDDDSGLAIGFIKILRDRTEQREAGKRLEDSERALREQQRQLRAVLDTIPVGILFAAAPDARIVGGNRRLEAMVGHPLVLSPEADGYAEWTAFHTDGRKVAGHEFPLVRIIQGDLDHDELECEYQRPDGSRWWMHIVGAPMRDADGTLLGAVVAISDISARRRADELQTLMNQELSHRLKNLMTIVQAITRQTIRSATDMKELQTTLSDRLMVLGSAHDLLLGGAVERAPLSAVIRGGTGVLGEVADAQLTLAGPDLEVGPAAALPLGLMMHELSTNAVKYGALSTAAGRVAITWSIDEAAAPPRFRLLWAESGGPPVSEPTRKGFGSSLITRGVGGLKGGAVTLAYRPEGVECRVEVLLSELGSG